MSRGSITKLLVANRGEIARRIMRTCRELGVSTVAVFSDADAGALFVHEADEAFALGGAAPAESYLRGDALIEAACTAGADAVHPGYGFLAENADFARAVIDAGLTWVGPLPEAIAAMGSKIEARARMEEAGVPVLPARVLESSEDDGLAAVAEEVGFPILAKASAGGGGKGMRLVRDPDALSDAVAAARREAFSAFGDDALFLERYLEEPRHVEIQIFGDEHGRVVSLFERECSIQRRHQKIVEESPSPALDGELRARMGAAAVAAGEAIGYVGAGTVEFLLGPDGEFFFLEVNTRLQVEHPVTELVTGLDLVALQLAVAEGRPLPAAAVEPVMDGHAIEARLYAEDPRNEFLPASGRLERFRVPEGVRVDTGVQDGSTISTHYDPMIAKVIAHASTREECARRLAAALERAQLLGVVTNRELLVRVLRHPEFLAGRTDTHFLERHDPAQLGAPLLDAGQERAFVAAAALERQARNRASAPVLSTLPSGWRSNPAALQATTYEGAHGPVEVGYRFGRDGELAVLEVAGETVDARLHECLPGVVDLEIGGRRRRYRVGRVGAEVHVACGAGQAALREQPRFATAQAAAAAGSLTSPMPGAVVRVMVGQGDAVEAGQPLVVIEAMKMEHEVIAPGAGTVSELLVGERDQVQTGTALVVIDEDGADGD